MTDYELDNIQATVKVLEGEVVRSESGFIYRFNREENQLEYRSWFFGDYIDLPGILPKGVYKLTDEENISKEPQYLTDINELEHVTKVKVHWPEWSRDTENKIESWEVYYRYDNDTWSVGTIGRCTTALDCGWKVEILERKD